MMARGPRIVAELGRPETPEETAARKAESSRIYRSSQSFRHLIAALVITLAVVAVIIFIVPRGEYAGPDSVDAAAAAAENEALYDHPLILPELPTGEDGWRVNAASVQSTAGGVSAWTLVYAPPGDGYLRLAQGFDTDEAWVRSVLRGAAPRETTTIDGREWEVYEFSDASAAGNVSYALATQAGSDRVLLYGTASPETTAALASSITPQLTTLEDSP